MKYQIKNNKLWRHGIKTYHVFKTQSWWEAGKAEVQSTFVLYLLYFRDASYIRVERLKVDENRVKNQRKWTIFPSYMTETHVRHEKKAEKKRILASFWRKNTVFLIVWKHNVTIYASKQTSLCYWQSDLYASKHAKQMWQCDNVTMWHLMFCIVFSWFWLTARHTK